MHARRWACTSTAADSPPSRRPTVADHQHSTPLLFASRLTHVSSNFITGVKRSNAPPPSANVNLRATVTPPSVAISLAEHHHWPRLEKAQPPVWSESATNDIPPADGDGQQELLTELTRSTLHPLTESNRSTQSTQHFQPPASSIPPPSLPKKSFAEVVAPLRASKIAKTAPNKYFLADSPQPAIGTILTDDQGPKLLFTDAETEVLAAPFRFALVGKFLHGAPSYSMLHKLMAGTGIKNRFTVSMLNNRYVLISLSCESNYTRLWLRRIWYIQGYPMRVFKWTPTFTPSKESSIVPVWVSFPELPAHLFRKEVLFTRIEYEDIPHYCSLCKHVGHRDSDCYTEGDAPKPPPRKPSNRAVAEKMKGKKVAEEVGRGKTATKEQVGTETTKAFERGESSRYPTNPSNCSTHEPADNLVVGANHVVVHDNIVSVNVANTTGDDGNMGEENSENLAEENWIQVGNTTMLLQEDSDKGETLVIDATPLKICDPPCFTNCNPADSVEQLLLELASPDKLPRNDFIVERLPEYLVKSTELKF
ncbi:UNVERIFIED_CONTAM: hypothetical protein Sindi_0554500 [Sesamum indicum]